VSVSDRAKYCRRDLITAAATATGIGEKTVSEVVDALVTGIILALLDGARVEIDGIGTLKPYKKPARMVRVVQGGNPVMVPGHRVDPGNMGAGWSSTGQQVGWFESKVPAGIGVKLVPDLALLEVLSPELAKYRRDKARGKYLQRRNGTASVGAAPAANACAATVGDEGPPVWLAGKRQAVKK